MPTVTGNDHRSRKYAAASLRVKRLPGVVRDFDKPMGVPSGDTSPVG
jgi:hypothetical protein